MHNSLGFLHAFNAVWFDLQPIVCSTINSLRLTACSAISCIANKRRQGKRWYTEVNKGFAKKLSGYPILSLLPRVYADTELHTLLACHAIHCAL